MIGTILGNRYRILRELGSGGMAWVYLAEDTLSGGFAAVKVLYPQFSQDVAYLQRFVREAKIASALTNPHIVKVLDYGSSRDVHYLVMEYIGGLDLKGVLAARGVLNWQEALAIARQVCLALEHASKFGIVHRDIKPQNLMMGDDGVVKVLDFGIARMATMPAITQSGLIGSPYYVSPEQAMGEQVDIRSDLYSLGVVLFELIAGETPFNADNAWSIISQHITDEPRLLRTLAPDTPPVVEELLSIALRKKKEDRFQTPDDFIRAVDAALTSDHLPEPTPALIQEPVPVEQTISEMYEQGLEAARDERFETALQFFSRVSRLSPGYLDNEAQLNRSLEYFRLEELYAAALSATQGENWSAALSSLKQIEALRPGYKDAASRLAKVELAICPTRIKEAPLEPVEIPGELIELPVEPGQAPIPSVELPAVEAAPAATGDILDYPVEPKMTEPRLSRLPRQASVTPSQPSASVGGVRYRGLLIVGLLVVFLGGGWLAISGMIDQARTPTVQQRYEQAMAEFNRGQWPEAIKEFERIQSISPNYEDVVARKEEAIKSRDLDRLYSEGQAQYGARHWAEAITVLTQVRSQDLTYKESSITSMLCDSYYQQALAQSRTNEAKTLQAVSALLGQGLEVCPTRADMLSLQKWTEDYLKAVVDVTNGQLERAAEELRALEGLEPNSGDARVASLLYQTYVRLAEKRRTEGSLPQAMEYYSQAVTVPGVEHSDAEQKRASLEQQLAPATPAPITAQPKSNPPAARTPATASPTPVADPTPTLPNVSRIRYPAPVLVSPATDTVFTSGQFGKIVLTWSGPEKLAPGEYYDVSILHFFNSAPVYWGTDTRENQLALTPDIGYGKADKDIFHWFVTIRSTQRTTSDGKPDGPAISPKSEAFTFVWR